MDPQFEELAKHIADDVEKRFDDVFVKRLGEAEKRLIDQFAGAETRLSDKFTAAETRLTEKFTEAETRLTEKFTEVETRLTEKFNEAETRLTEKFTEAEKRLSNGATMNMEELRTATKLAAEGYGATLERIERQLTELNTKWDTTIGDHGRAITDHGARISALERRQ